MNDAILDSLLDPLSQCLDVESARRIADFPADPRIEDRIHELAELSGSGALTEAERAEYEALVNAADFISILKIKARRSLGGSGAA